MNNVEAGVLKAGAELTLERATSSDLDDVVALQFAAYARNRELLGLEPLPLLADYALLLASHEIWIARRDKAIGAALILEPRPGDLLIWSIATDPGRQQRGVGASLLRASETRARELGKTAIRLYTGSTLDHLINWYTRHGYEIERTEMLEDRSIAHMVKHLDCPAS